MPIPYKEPHWTVFSTIPHVAAGAGGVAPEDWVQSHNLEDTPDDLPSEQLDRHQVRNICQDKNKPVLFCYLCVMAWGAQGGKGFRSDNVQSAWENRFTLERHLKALRSGGLTRSAAYNLFQGEGNIKGLGPAYLTKLLYFFSPTNDFYIMDQWTSKSINLLTGLQVVRLDGNVASGKNKCGNYQAYCEEIDEIAALLVLPGADIEEMLMSKGGRTPWPWRAHLKQYYDYNPSVLHEIYPHIAIGAF